MKTIRQGAESILADERTIAFQYKQAERKCENRNRFFLTAVNNAKKANKIHLSEALRQITDNAGKLLHSLSLGHFSETRLVELLNKNLNQTYQRLEILTVENKLELVMGVADTLWRNGLYDSTFSYIFGQELTLTYQQANIQLDKLTFMILLGCADGEYSDDQSAEYLEEALMNLTKKIDDKSSATVIKLAALIAARLNHNNLFPLLKLFTDNFCSHHAQYFPKDTYERPDDNTTVVRYGKVYG